MYDYSYSYYDYHLPHTTLCEMLNFNQCNIVTDYTTIFIVSHSDMWNSRKFYLLTIKAHDKELTNRRGNNHTMFHFYYIR